jgi:hypothetical protein
MTVTFGTIDRQASFDATATPDWTRTILHHGDIHHGASNVATRSAISGASIQALPAPAAVVQIGDMVEPDSGANDTTAKTYLNSLPGATKRVVIGNHDVDSGRTPDQAATAFGYNARNWTLDLSFARLIGVSPGAFPPNGDPLEGTCTLDQTALDYLDAQLASATLPCLVFTHAPLANTVIAPALTGDNAGWDSTLPVFSIDPDTEIRAILAARPAAKAFISGHTHSFMSCTGFVKVEDVGGRDVVCINSSAIRGQHNPAHLLDPIIVVFTTLTDTHIEVRVHDCRIRRWARWPATNAYVQRIPIPE